MAKAMRRAKSSSGLSPRQLKHFAGIAVVLTGLLALFVSGEDWGAAAQVKAVEKRNRLLETEQQKVGTRRLLNTIAVRPGVAAIVSDDGGGGGIEGPAMASAAAPMQPERAGPPVRQGGPSIDAETLRGPPGIRSRPMPEPRMGKPGQKDPRAVRAAALKQAGGKDQGDW